MYVCVVICIVHSFAYAQYECTQCPRIICSIKELSFSHYSVTDGVWKLVPDFLVRKHQNYKIHIKRG